ncbi:MAG: DivIVA domain-containing protein [Bacillota bacterium]
MALTPLDIQNAEFKVSFRGYNQAEVDGFLNKILIDFEKLYKENQQLKESIKKIEEELSKYKVIEDNLSAALVIAQKTSQELKETAHREADVIIKEAKLEAAKIYEETQQKVHKKEEELANLHNQFVTFKLKMLAFIESHYKLLKDEVDTLQKQKETAES